MNALNAKDVAYNLAFTDVRGKKYNAIWEIGAPGPDGTYIPGLQSQEQVFGAGK